MTHTAHTCKTVLMHCKGQVKSLSGRVPSNDGLGGVDFQEDMGCKYARYTRGQVLGQGPATPYAISP